jgi:hypothetical protein
MPGIVTAGVSYDDRKSTGENVDDLSFPFVAPLGAYYDCSLGSHEFPSVSCGTLFRRPAWPFDQSRQTWTEVARGIVAE